jgi:hypothetical protein
MPTLSQLSMLAAADITWPISYRFVAAGGTNFTSWEISVDAPGLNGMHDESVALGPEIFSNTIATAICSSIDLVYFDYVIHRLSPIPSIGSGGSKRGRIFGTPAPRIKSACIGFNTGHSDSFGRRQHYLYGMPFNWQDGAMLTERGWDGAMGYAHLLAMGMQKHFIDGNLQHLIAYWGVIPAEVGNFWGVGFRRVTSYNVFQYVDKAPELSENLWPPSGT